MKKYIMNQLTDFNKISRKKSLYVSLPLINFWNQNNSIWPPANLKKHNNGLNQFYN